MCDVVSCCYLGRVHVDRLQPEVVYLVELSWSYQMSCCGSNTLHMFLLRQVRWSVVEEVPLCRRSRRCVGHEEPWFGQCGESARGAVLQGQCDPDVASLNLPCRGVCIDEW